MTVLPLVSTSLVLAESHSVKAKPSVLATLFESFTSHVTTAVISDIVDVHHTRT